ncbi:MAG TPA: hypothetical protein VEA79_11220 [Phenylobacterium sp.]|nr:hypothetical protein [Phenylobacterium sp.]
MTNLLAALGRGWRAMLAAAPIDRWALFGASIVITLLFIGGGALIYLGAWPAALAAKRLDLIGTGFLMMGAGMLMVIASYTMVSFRLKGPGGVEAEIGREMPPASPTVTATATPSGSVQVTATPGQPPFTPPTGGRDDLAQ